MPYFPTRNVLHDRKRRFLRGFSVADFSAEKYIKNILQEMNGLSLRQQQLPLIMYYKAVTDPDLHIRGGGGGHPDPEIRGGAVSKKFF